MAESDAEIEVRAALFEHLSDLRILSPDGLLRASEIKSFTFRGEKVVVKQQRGINQPKGFKGALSITTTFTPYGQIPPYTDYEGEDGYHRYKYEGTDPLTFTNKSLRYCMEHGLPLVYFLGVRPAVYEPIYPAYIIGEDPSRHEFIVAFNPVDFVAPKSQMTDVEKKYILQETRRRVHQPIFRERVLHAYSETCAVCRFRHRELLDAAHIIEDSNLRGDPIVENGLALCKMHHAAFDRNFLGITPDYEVRISKRLLAESDGPMLKHGLQEMNGIKLKVPRPKELQPSPSRLEERFEAFRLSEARG